MQDSRRSRTHDPSPVRWGEKRRMIVLLQPASGVEATHFYKAALLSTHDDFFSWGTITFLIISTYEIPYIRHFFQSQGDHKVAHQFQLREQSCSVIMDFQNFLTNHAHSSWVWRISWPTTISDHDFYESHEWSCSVIMKLQKFMSDHDQWSWDSTSSDHEWSCSLLMSIFHDLRSLIWFLVLRRWFLWYSKFRLWS